MGDVGASPKSPRGRIFLAILLAALNHDFGQVVVAADIDVIVIRRFIAVGVDVEIVGLQRGFALVLAACLLAGVERQRLLGLQDRLRSPAVAAIDAGDRVILRQIIEACSAFWALALCAPFGLDHLGKLPMGARMVPGP